MNICVDTILPKKSVKLYPNVKPWITKEVKNFLEAKQCTLQTDGRVPLKMAQAELIACARKCKEDYRNTMHAIFKQNNTKQAWHSNNSNKLCCVSNSTEFAAALTIVTLKPRGIVLASMLNYYQSTHSRYTKMQYF